MSEAAGERRETPLARELKEEIRRTGPITIAAYMQACLQHPAHGYYRKAAAVAAGEYRVRDQPTLAKSSAGRRRPRRGAARPVHHETGRGTCWPTRCAPGASCLGSHAARVACREQRALRVAAETLSGISAPWHARLAEVPARQSRRQRVP
jgi:hypothetical protein